MKDINNDMLPAFRNDSIDISKKVVECKGGNAETPKVESKEVITAQNFDGVTITSLEIAELTGKRHDHILRDIEEQLGKIIDAPKFGDTYKDAYGRDKKCYRLPKREALILVSGYSVELRAKIIDRLEYLENEFKKQNIPQLPQNYLEALKALTAEVEQRMLLEQKIEIDKPKVEYAEALLSSDNSQSIADFARFLCGKGVAIGQNRLFDWLREHGYLKYDNLPYQRFVDKGYFELMPQTYIAGIKTITRYKLFVTPKGQHYFTKILLRTKK